jgi:hypothetical protein
MKPEERKETDAETEIEYLTRAAKDLGMEDPQEWWSRFQKELEED